MNVLVDFYAHHSRLIDEIGINALLALSLSVSLQAGQLALAQAGLAGIAAYVSAIASMQYHAPLAGSIVLAILASTLVAALLAYPVRKLRGIFLAIATVGFGEIVRVIANNLKITGGAEGLSGIPNDVNTAGHLRRPGGGRGCALRARAHQVRARGRVDARRRGGRARRRRRHRHGALLVPGAGRRDRRTSRRAVRAFVLLHRTG